MFTSFYTALSGLNAMSTAINVVGNNLANLNTPGFKASTISFQDLVSQSMGADPSQTQVGFGVSSPLTTQQFVQGALQTTSSPLDAAIQGQGFFVVNSSSGATEYTRAGNFQVNSDGVLQTSSGGKVQGWIATNGVLNTNGPTGNITVPVGTTTPPIATQSFSFDLNLNAAAAPSSTNGTFTTSVQIYDSLGNSHVATATFTKDPTNANQWNYSVSVPDSDLKNPPFTPLTGSLTFDSNGNLTTPAATDPAPQLQIQGLADGASDLTLNWKLFNGTSPRVTQFAQASAVSAVNQDGSAPAELTQVGISSGGQILAQFSNGQQSVVGQLAVASIRNPESLISAGGNNYEVSADTAAPAIGAPDTGGRGDVIGGALESSSVDIAREFTNLIIFQRGYEANSKVITAVNELSQTTTSLIT